MKRIQLCIVVLLVVLAPLYGQRLDVPVAIVRLHETSNISQRKLRSQHDLIEQQLGRSIKDEDRRRLLEAEISAELINQDAEHLNIRITEEEIEAAIEQQRATSAPNTTRTQFRQAVITQTNLSWEEYRKQIRNRLRQEKYILQKKSELFENIELPSESEVEIFYEENATRFANPAMVRFEHIYIDTRNTTNVERTERRRLADRIRNQLRANAKTFDQLLNESLDNPDFSGGDFGYLLRQDTQSATLLGQPFVNDLFRIDVNEISDGVLESNVGFHIVRVKDRRMPKLLGLQDPLLPGQTVTVRDQIRNLILANTQQQLFQQAISDTVEELRARADITIYEQNLDW